MGRPLVKCFMLQKHMCLAFGSSEGHSAEAEKANKHPRGQLHGDMDNEMKKMSRTNEGKGGNKVS